MLRASTLSQKDSPAYGRGDFRLNWRTLACRTLESLAEHREHRAIALSPYRAFHRGRDKLPVFRDVAFLRVDEDSGAVKGAIVAFDDAHDEEDICLLADLLDPGYGGRGDLNRGFGVANEFIPSFLPAVPNDQPKGGHLRISADAGRRMQVCKCKGDDGMNDELCFWEHDELRTIPFLRETSKSLELVQSLRK